MPNTVLLGAQWGDEGKGKVVDVLTHEADLIVRYQGGSNAGHTVIFGAEKHVLHLIPSGILHPGKACVIGNGVVVDPLALWAEIRELEARNVAVAGRLHVSDRAHMVLRYHQALDAAEEGARSDAERIGTTQRGIGPAYRDKMSRTGLRMGDLLEPDFPQRLADGTRHVNGLLRALEAPELDVDAVCREYADMPRLLGPYVTDTVTQVNAALRQGRNLLLEGAQGTMLDVDFGTYPFVTSSNPTAGGACTGAGVPPTAIDRVIGIIKAYTTRVGAGPFPTELTDELGAELRRKGNEFGATTGRPRRCGWFDAVVGRHAAMINGVQFWAVTKLDVLDALPEIRICVAYECDGRRIESFPASIERLARCRPVYETMPGWQCDTRNITRYDDLPEPARRYVERLIECLGGRLGILSLGPARETTLRIDL